MSICATDAHNGCRNIFIADLCSWIDIDWRQMVEEHVDISAASGSSTQSLQRARGE